ncbi:MAG: AMP-binding protein [Deltaproteobacteria bacterium]|nr:AMP-binding protein [Deltaproteobacteria bacterium]
MKRIWQKQYEKAVPLDIDPSVYNSIVDLLEESFDKFGSKTAYVNMGGQLSYSELDRLSRDFAAYLQQSLCLKQGDRVAIMMPNLIQYPVALFGVLRAGMVAVNVNPLYTPRELEHQLKDSGAKAIVILENFAHVLQKAIDNTAVKNVIITRIGDMLPFLKSKIVNLVVKHVKKMVPDWRIANHDVLLNSLKAGANKTFNRPEIKSEDTAFLQYTGGTTGVAKGAILTHRNIVSNVLQAKAWVGHHFIEGEEIVITPLPLYHIFSLTANCLFMTVMGGTNVLITNPRDIPNFVKELKKWRFTFITGVNTLFGGLLNNPEFAQLDFTSMKIALGGGMAVTQAVAQKWTKVTGKVLLEAYGLTETSPAACINPANLKEFNGCIGLPIPSTDIKIIDEDEKEVKLGEAGELCFKGPQVTQGYWNKPEDTKNLFTGDGWLKTGDIASLDKLGFVKIVDRKKDMILVSGFNVYPNEVEDVVTLMEGILEAAVVGIPDEKSGEAVKLFVVKKDPNLTKEAVLAHCKENLTGYKRPKEIEFKDELPKTNVGKILRRALRQ